MSMRRLLSLHQNERGLVIITPEQIQTMVERSRQTNKRHDKTAKVVSLLVGFFLALSLAIILLAWLRMSSSSNEIPACQINLENIAICKQHWEDDQTNKNTKAVPTWEDLRPYFPSQWSNNIPVCPAGGTCIIGRVSENPICSIGGYDHSLHERWN
jgi:hypothetical protein